MSRAIRIGTTGLVLIAISGLVGACSQRDEASPAGGDGAEVAEESEALGKRALAPAAQGAPAARGGAATGVAATTADAAYGAGNGTQVGSSLLQTPRIGPSVIKTADVEVEVARDDFQSAVNQAIGLAGRYGGFVVSTSIDDAEKQSGTVTLRVPAEDFERVLSSLEGLGEVQNEIVTGRDVSQEFIDLDARIRNYESQEAVLLRLMERATTINESIRVQHELQSIRLEIDRLRGRLRYLRNQAAMSTISMRIVEAGVITKEPPKIGALGKAWDRAVAAALAVVAAVIVGTGAVLPVALLLGIAFLLVRALRPRWGSAT